jgi:hypothetical protein
LDGGSCEICGEHNVAGTRFCTSCGAYLGWEGSVVPLSEQPVAPRPNGRARPPSGLTAGAATATEPTRPVDPARSSEPTLTIDRAPRAGGSVDVADAPDTPKTPIPAPADPNSTVCPDCHTANEPSRRFCRRCGFVLRAPVSPLPPPVPTRRWWQRWLRRADDGSATTFGRSLPMRVRLLRVIGVLAALVLALGLFRFVGRDPLAWTRHTINDLRGSLVTVDGLTVRPDPAGDATAQTAANALVDAHPDTSWSASWTDPTTGATNLDCGPVGPQSAVLITAPRSIRLRAIQLRGGLSTEDQTRLLQSRPRILELRFSNGTCQRVTVKDVFDRQTVSVRAVTTDTVRVSVVGTYAPEVSPGIPAVSISEMSLLTRPK